MVRLLYMLMIMYTQLFTKINPHLKKKKTYERWFFKSVVAPASLTFDEI